jgi:hypothetical protein
MDSAIDFLMFAGHFPGWTAGQTFLPTKEILDKRESYYWNFLFFFYIHA